MRVSGKTGLVATIFGFPAKTFTRSFKVVSQRRADAVDHSHADQDADQDGRHLRVFEYAQRRDQFEANATSADRAEHGRGAEIVFPAIDRGVRQLGQHLWKHRMKNDLERRGPGRTGGPDRLWVNVLAA